MFNVLMFAVVAVCLSSFMLVVLVVLVGCNSRLGRIMSLAAKVDRRWRSNRANAAGDRSKLIMRHARRPEREDRCRAVPWS